MKESREMDEEFHVILDQLSALDEPTQATINEPIRRLIVYAAWANSYAPCTLALRKVLIHAQSEAHHHWYAEVGTRHLLLGLLIHGKGVAAQVFTSIGINCSVLLSHLEEHIGVGNTIGNDTLSALPLSAHAQQVMTYAQQERMRLRHGNLGTELLLLGLAHCPTSTGAQSLVDYGIDLNVISDHIYTLIGIH